MIKKYERLDMNETHRKMLRLLCVIVFAGCSAYLAIWLLGGYISRKESERLADMFYSAAVEAVPENEAEQSGGTVNKRVKAIKQGLDALAAINNDTVGWLKIEGTSIDYPVVKGTDNMFYLSHNFNKEPDSHGTVFMDTNCQGRGLENTLIYGHNMKDGTMFRDLMKYRDESFYREHPQIVYTNREGSQYSYNILGAFYWDGETASPFGFHEIIELSEKSFWEYLGYLQEHSFYQTNAEVEKLSPLLTLATCDNNASNARIVVVAVLDPV